MSRELSLCCCEYVSDTGELNHLLACCCNCQAVDETFDSVLCCRGVPKGAWARIQTTLSDRIRIPYCDGNGARKLNRSKFYLLMTILSPSAALILCAQGVFIVTVPTVLIGLTYLCVFSNNSFIWCLSSMVWLLLSMQFITYPDLKILFIEHFLLMLGVSCVCVLGHLLRTAADKGHKESLKYSSKGLHYSHWLSCYVQDKFIYTLFLVSVLLTSSFYADLVMTSVCRSRPSELMGDLILLPDDCSMVFDDDCWTALSFSSGLYALGMAAAAILSIVILLISQAGKAISKKL